MVATEDSELTGVKSAQTNMELAVSARVAVRLESGVTVTGTIIEDFANLLPADGEVSIRADEHRTVTARRWGIAVDDGTLVFVDDAAVRALPAD